MLNQVADGQNVGKFTSTTKLRLDGSLITLAVRPAAELPFPLVYTETGLTCRDLDGY